MYVICYPEIQISLPLHMLEDFSIILQAKVMGMCGQRGTKISLYIEPIRAWNKKESPAILTDGRA